VKTAFRYYSVGERETKALPLFGGRKKKGGGWEKGGKEMISPSVIGRKDSDCMIFEEMEEGFVLEKGK